MRKFKPLVDKLYYIIMIPTVTLLVVLTAVAAISPVSLLASIPVDLFVIWFFVSPLFGYVELRENSLYIKYGLILKKEIPYDKIVRVEKERRFYSESMMSLKNALEHVNIRYNRYDLTCVSVVGNDELIEEIDRRIRSDTGKRT